MQALAGRKPARGHPPALSGLDRLRAPPTLPGPSPQQTDAGTDPTPPNGLRHRGGTGRGPPARTGQGARPKKKRPLSNGTLLAGSPTGRSVPTVLGLDRLHGLLPLPKTKIPPLLFVRGPE